MRTFAALVAVLVVASASKADGPVIADPYFAGNLFEFRGELYLISDSAKGFVKVTLTAKGSGKIGLTAAERVYIRENLVGHSVVLLGRLDDDVIRTYKAWTYKEFLALWFQSQDDGPIR